MPNDFITLQCLAKELNALLSQSKIDKIYQPERDELTFTIRAKGDKQILSISASAQNPRIHLTSVKKENPSTAPTLCMHLRKLLASGYINSICLANSDRIFDINISSVNELNDRVTYHLMFEMMGRYSNIILLNESMIILDAVKIVPFDGATKRCLLIGAKYEFPEQSKILPMNYSAAKEYLKAYSGGNISKYFLSGVSGLSPITAEELLRGYDNLSSLTDHDIDNIISKLESMYNIYGTAEFKPCCLVDDMGNAKDYFIYPYNSIISSTHKNSLSDAIESCLLTKDVTERQREHTKHLTQAVKKYRARQEKKLQKAFEKLEECSKIETYKKFGELITCNLNIIHKGDSSVTLTDYYDESMPLITIPLNQLLHPNGCAQEYFKKYNKLKRTLAVINPQIKETEAAIQYSYSIDNGITNCATQSELIQMEEELVKIGALKKSSSKKNKHIKPSEPYYYEYGEFSIMVGKNNIQNDKLTFKVANGNDLWIHALDYHGSHAIIFAESKEIPDDVIQIGCELAAYYSQGNANDKVAVDYTRRRNVKRDNSGNLGMVTYTGQSTAYVRPDKHADLLI